MKGLFCACLLASLQSLNAARAYEADIHYSTTYVLARAVGWSEADAMTIASANQGVDENQDTVAALEVNATPSASFAGYVTSSLHQAEKNLRFHCFSGQPAHTQGISADVVEVMSGHFAGVPAGDADPRGKTKRLIALGVALHCQQDAFAHVDFGGKCGEYAGSCYGHTYQNFLDHVAFGLLKKHYYNPDHPGVSGKWLLDTLQGTVRELAARRPRGAARPLSAEALVALSDALRSSGLELPDEVRRECNRYIAGKWLHDLHRADGVARARKGEVEMLPLDVAGRCGNESLASAKVARIPEPRFPRLNPDASPQMVRADGSYQLLQQVDVAVSLPGIHRDAVSKLLPDYRAHGIRVHLSHWSQVLALPFLGTATSAGSGDIFRPRVARTSR